MSYYQITEIADGAYRITSKEAVFMDLIVGEEKALLLDTGWGLGPLRETVRQITDKPLIIVNSHGHVDHVNGNNQFEDTVYMHQKDMELRKVHGSAMMKQFILQTVSKGDFLPEDFQQARYLEDGKNVYEPVEEGYVFDLGGKTLEVIELPGHTIGSIGLLYREGRILYTADGITKMVLINGDEAADLTTYKNTLKKALALDFDKFAQGHVAELEDRSEMERFLRLAEAVDWDKAEPYQDPSKPEVPANDNVRVICEEGMTMADITKPNFIAIVLSKANL